MVQVSHDDDDDDELMCGAMAKCLKACLGKPSNEKWIVDKCSREKHSYSNKHIGRKHIRFKESCST